MGNAVSEPPEPGTLAILVPGEALDVVFGLVETAGFTGTYIDFPGFAGVAGLLRIGRGVHAPVSLHLIRGRIVLHDDPSARPTWRNVRGKRLLANRTRRRDRPRGLEDDARAAKAGG